MTHFTGFIIAKIAKAVAFCWSGADGVTVSNHQANGAYGVHQATVRLKGDPNTYRMILAPADAPITINGRPIGEHFAKPLGDG